MLIRQMDKFLRHFLFEIKFWIKTLQRSYRFLESFNFLRVFLSRSLQKLAVVLADQLVQLLHLRAQPRQQLHITFAALDFFIEYHSVETLAALGQLPGQIEVRLGDKAKAINML